MTATINSTPNLHRDAMAAHLDAVTLRMMHQALMLSAISQAMTLDLAIAPVIVSGDLADDAKTMLAGLSAGLGMRYIERFDAETKGDFALPAAVPTLMALRSDRPENICPLLQQLETCVKMPIVLVINTTLENEDAVLTAIDQTLKINRAHVPTARLDRSRKVSQPFLVTGFVSHEGSKRGEQYFSIATLPHDAELRFTVRAPEDLNDHRFHEALDPLYSHQVHAALRLEESEDGLILALNAFDVMD